MTFDLLRFRPYRLFHLSRTWTETMDAYFSRAHGLSILELRVISLLARLKGSTASELSVYAHLDKTQMSRTLAKLGDKGLVERLQHATDQRRQAIHLTPHGEEVNAIAVQIATRLDAWLFEAIAERQQPQFDEALDRLTARIAQLPQAINEMASQLPTAKVARGASSRKRTKAKRAPRK